MISAIENLPDVTFVEDLTLEEVQANLIEAYEEKYAELTGEELELDPVSPEALKLYAASTIIFQLAMHIDNAGKMNLLKYSYGDYLDNLAANSGVERLPAQPAVTTVRFTVSEPQGFDIAIPKNTRVSNGGDIYFATDEEATITAGETYTDVACTCQEEGEDGNGIIAGILNNLVDPIYYIESVANTETTYGGSDTEDDDELTDRTYLAPSTYSTAGPEDAYRYYAMSYSSQIADVEVTSPEPCEVYIRVILEGGMMPTQTMLDEIEEALDDTTVRPCGDRITVAAPTAQLFDVDMTYYIDGEDRNKAETIQELLDEAVEEYIDWQTSKIARDINPSTLIQQALNAGAKRVEVASPAFAQVPAGYVAKLGSKTVTYGGVE